ncbi:protein LEAD-SENSITIVE 1-like [Alnus glutinosa]|uniref:protein LEAD-SENSITIVE 1-like n=1 Tax=Alnus glutinosa TaxID=3517 RepID=UPI002D795C88|nr:protein LEAD-SENSITIVE 1-like [Alnus glutinosa]
MAPFVIGSSLIMSHIEFAGIFIGENKVVHFTRDRDLNSSSGISSDSSFYNSRLICSSYPECEFRKPNRGVVRSCLDCFLRNESLYRYECGVSQPVFLAHLRGGTCTTAKSDPPAEVIRRASYLLERGFGNDDLLQNNCEDFALYCKTGLLTLDKLGVGASGQVSSVFGAPLEAIFSSCLNLGMPSHVSRAVVKAEENYSLDRYEADIGVRDDVMKVAVEDLAVKLGWEGQHHEEVADDTEASKRDSVAKNLDINEIYQVF